MMIRAELCPFRRSRPRRHVQAVPGWLLALSRLDHGAMTVRSTYPGNGKRGHAESGKTHVSTPGTRQWAPCISNYIPENVKMQPVIRR